VLRLELGRAHPGYVFHFETTNTICASQQRSHASDALRFCCQQPPARAEHLTTDVKPSLTPNGVAARPRERHPSPPKHNGRDGYDNVTTERPSAPARRLMAAPQPRASQVRTELGAALDSAATNETPGELAREGTAQGGAAGGSDAGARTPATTITADRTQGGTERDFITGRGR